MKTINFAKKIRLESLKMVYESKASHIGSALSISDIIAVLYNDILNFNSNNPKWEKRDRFILSKGHACVALYSALGLKKFFNRKLFKTYTNKNSILMSHVSHKVPGVEFSTGSLGQGLPFAVGKAFYAKKNNKTWKTFALLSDGELNEGSNWESIFFAGYHKLENLTIIIDNNKIQGMGNTNEILNIEPYLSKLPKKEYEIIKVDGHNISQLNKSLKIKSLKPKLVIANTIKGKGVNFMENNNLWHYKNPDKIQYLQAVKSL